MTRLWSIQNAAFFNQVIDEGRGSASWDHVGKTAEDAYRWIVEQTERRLNKPSSGNPPIWAWHSCGGWHSPPTPDDFLALFGAEPQPHLDLRIATLDVPDDSFSLSFYGPWCDMFFAQPFDPNAEAVKDLWFDGDPEALEWPEQGNDRDLQAVLLHLERDQITSIKSTAEAFNAW